MSKENTSEKPKVTSSNCFFCPKHNDSLSWQTSHTFSGAGRLLEGFVSRILRSHRTETEQLTDSSWTDRRGRFCLKWETVLYLRFIFQLKWHTVHDDSHTHSNTHTRSGERPAANTQDFFCVSKVQLHFLDSVSLQTHISYQQQQGSSSCVITQLQLITHSDSVKRSAVCDRECLQKYRL